MQQTMKHICIFLVFLVCVYLWKEADPYLESYARHLIPRQIRNGIVLFIWSTVVVAIWHLLFYYMGKMANKVVYITSAIVVVGALLVFGMIEVF